MAEKRIVSAGELFALIYDDRARELALIFADELDVPWLPLIDVELRVCSFVAALLQCAHIERSRLLLALFSAADLAGSQWSEVRLVGCHFRKAVLRDAVFENVVFDRCVLRGADTRGALFHNCVFKASQLVPHKTAKLEACTFVPGVPSAEH